MSVSPVSSASSSNTSAVALLASASILPSNTAIAAIADTPTQILSEISQLEQDEEVSASGQPLAQIQQDLQRLEQAQKQQEQKTAALESASSQGVAESATPSSSASTEPILHLNARA
jgi:cell shape-determining protein MreC